MAAGDVTVHGTSGRTIRGRRMIWGTVQLDGGNPTPVDLSAYCSALDTFVVSPRGSSAPALDPTHFTTGISGAVGNVYAWKPTASGDATLIASTNNAAVLDFVAVGRQ